MIDTNFAFVVVDFIVATSKVEWVWNLGGSTMFLDDSNKHLFESFIDLTSPPTSRMLEENVLSNVAVYLPIMPHAFMPWCWWRPHCHGKDLAGRRHPWEPKQTESQRSSIHRWSLDRFLLAAPRLYPTNHQNYLMWSDHQYGNTQPIYRCIACWG